MKWIRGFLSVIFLAYFAVTGYIIGSMYYKVSKLEKQATEIIEQFNSLPKIHKTIPHKPKPKPQNIPKLGPFPDGGRYLFGK